MYRVTVENKEPNKETIFKLKTCDGQENLYTTNQLLDVCNNAVDQAKFRLKCFFALVLVSIFNIFYVTKDSSFSTIMQSVIANDAPLNISVSIILNLVLFVLIIPISLIYYYFFQSCKDNIDFIQTEK